MVEYTTNLDAIFSSLSHPIRRDILQRVAEQEQTTSALAEQYDVSLAAISKHLSVLEKAQLIVRRKLGRERLVRLSPVATQEAAQYLQYYRRYWENQLDALEKHLSQ